MKKIICFSSILSSFLFSFEGLAMEIDSESGSGIPLTQSISIDSDSDTEPEIGVESESEINSDPPMSSPPQKRQKCTPATEAKIYLEKTPEEDEKKTGNEPKKRKPPFLKRQELSILPSEVGGEAEIERLKEENNKLRLLIECTKVTSEIISAWIPTVSTKPLETPENPKAAEIENKPSMESPFKRPISPHRPYHPPSPRTGTAGLEQRIE